MPVFPDDHLGRHSLTFVTFDAPPVSREFNELADSNAAVHDSALLEHPGKRFGLYCPSKKPAPKIPEGKEVAEVDHLEWNREYTTRPVPKTKENENIVFVFAGPSVRYIKYDSRLSLRKRNKHDGGDMKTEVRSRPSTLTVNTLEA